MKSCITLFSMTIVLLAGCSKPTEVTVAPLETTISVNVHGVNYTADEFRYMVVDPNNPSSKGGGELIEPFSGGRCHVLLYFA